MNYWRPKAVPAQSVVEELARDISQLITTTKLGSLEVFYAQPAIRFLHSFGTKYVDLNRQQVILEIRQLEEYWANVTGHGSKIEGEQTMGEDDE